jgi:hypothetical protein
MPPNNRAYLTTADAAKSAIEISKTDNFMDVVAKDITLRGFKITRYSPSGGRLWDDRCEFSGRLYV